MNDAIVYPNDPANVGQIPSLLSAYAGKYEQIQARGMTGYFWVPALDQDTANNLRASVSAQIDYTICQVFHLIYESSELIIISQPDVYDVSYYEQLNAADGGIDLDSGLSKRTSRDLSRSRNKPPRTRNVLPGTSPASPLVKRAKSSEPATEYWHPSINSLPKGAKWRSGESQSFEAGAAEPYKYWYDDTGGAGMKVYLIGEEGVWADHPVSYINPDTIYRLRF
jgi:hypothetical protein